MITLDWDDALDAASALYSQAERFEGAVLATKSREYRLLYETEALKLRALADRITAAHEASHPVCLECGRALDNGLCSTCDVARPSMNGWATTD